MKANTLQKISLIISLTALVSGITRSLGSSFTFDFEHPDGAGSSFVEAVPLCTAGALKDSIGQPIGFTHRSAFSESHPPSGVSGVTLTSSGLTFDTGVGEGDTAICIGVPFPTNGSGMIQVTARFSGVSGMDMDFEGIGVGIGESEVPPGTVLFMDYAYVFHNGTHPIGPLVYQVSASPLNHGHNHVSGEQDIRSITLSAPTIAGGVLTGMFDGASVDANVTGVNDNTSDSRLGRNDTFAYVVLAKGGSSPGLGLIGTLTSISFSGPNVVAPSVCPANSIEALIEQVAALNLQQGIENSLDTKLDSALNALDDLNENNDEAACNSMQAFINAVEAQRNKKITSPQADELIAAAQAILDVLGCGQ